MLRLLLLLALVVSTAYADRPRITAARRSTVISIDGHLDESAWQTAPVQSGFTQRFPKDGGSATLPTRFAVMFDDAAIYVGVWADDPEPAKIRGLLARRDVSSSSDEIAIGIDSYHDQRTGYVFQVNAAGVLRDSIIFDDTTEDTTWDAVWTGNATVTSTGWTAELRIPLNQLRFSAAPSEWGLQVVRTVQRTQEQSAWSPWPRSGPEMVSRFGVVDGLSSLRPGRRLELLPYASGGVDVMPVDAADPFADHVAGRGGLGLDLKYGLSSAFTLSATINPDFGQVEADPSQINLSGNELFFAEKRPFFLEGAELFKLGIGNSSNSPEGQFYSRRIGAAPPAPGGSYDYASVPTSTTIYTAAKLTGKTPGGWSIGVFDAVTGEETATIAGENVPDGRMDLVAAPLTNYAVARLKRDLRGGLTSIGLSATAVNRDLADTGLESLLHDQAYTGGLQLQHRFAGPWQADISLVGSYVHGSETAIAATQTAVRHLYQRPDATNAHFDPTRTSLLGGGATWKIGKLGDTKHLRYFFGGDVRTIGLELNDAGFQTMSDRAIPFLLAEYRDDEPGDTLLNWSFSSDVFLVSTLEPTLTDYGIECNGNAQLANYWQFGINCNIDAGIVEPVVLRGGPAIKTDTNYQGGINITTDTRKALQVSLGAMGYRTFASHSIGGAFELGATLQARSNIDLFIGPAFSDRNDSMQYIDQVDDSEGERHYILGRIRQTTASLTMRLNWAFTPHLTLQAYAQPFIATGRYSELKDVDHPRAERWEERFTRIEGAYSLENDVYSVRAPSGAAYQFDRPDFGFSALRSTLVVRWEYRPGSTIFAIWSHGQSESSTDGRFRLGPSADRLTSAAGENTVMVKANYWIGL